MTFFLAVPDQLLLPIMTAKATEVDINNLRADLVQGRAFVMVFNHLNYLTADQVCISTAILLTCLPNFCATLWYGICSDILMHT